MSEEEFQNLKELIDANAALKQKLDAMSKQKQQLNSVVRASKPVLPGQAKAVTRQYANVRSKIDPDNITVQLKTQEELKKLRREEFELKDCSFRPNINVKSAEIVQSNVYIPIYERPAPERKPAESTRDLVESEVFEPEIPKVRKKADPEFYKRQLEWQRKMEEKQQNERLQKQLSEHSELYQAPRTNKETNERLGGEPVDFMERLRIQEERAKQRRLVLESKYNDCTFRPKINAKSQNVTSRVFQARQMEQEED